MSSRLGVEMERRKRSRRRESSNPLAPCSNGLVAAGY
jgi:hypothetical protein